MRELAPLLLINVLVILLVGIIIVLLENPLGLLGLMFLRDMPFPQAQEDIEAVAREIGFHASHDEE
jgi:hypothetical protein